MWVALRATFGILLACLIVVIVVSPYVDLPQTTLRARQAAIRILGVLALCWAAVAGRHERRRSERVSSQELDLRGLHDRHPLGLACVLLC
ncbi:MAG: hypothetical protein WCC59_12240 [Terriglobales bacterium]